MDAYFSFQAGRSGPLNQRPCPPPAPLKNSVPEIAKPDRPTGEGKAAGLFLIWPLKTRRRPVRLPLPKLISEVEEARRQLEVVSVQAREVSRAARCNQDPKAKRKAR